MAEDTERFVEFIWSENERLNRLIRNLYLHFQLKDYSERELYDRICQEIADYFRTDTCELFLIHYDQAWIGDAIPAGTSMRPQRSLKRWLQLVGATGPWSRALRQQYVREKSLTRYEMAFGEALPSTALSDISIVR